MLFHALYTESMLATSSRLVRVPPGIAPIGSRAPRKANGFASPARDTAARRCGEHAWIGTRRPFSVQQQAIARFRDAADEETTTYPLLATWARSGAAISSPGWIRSTWNCRHGTLASLPHCKSSVIAPQQQRKDRVPKSRIGCSAVVRL